MKIGAPDITDEQCVAGQHHPRVLGACQVCNEVGVVSGSVAGSRDDLDEGVAELDYFTIGEGDVVEVESCSDREVSGRPGALDQRRQPGNVICLEVRFENADDGDSLRLRQLDVGVDQVYVGIDHRELGLARAAEEVGRASRVVSEKLSEEHGLTSYQVIY